jgi:hypothetical protein
VSESAARRRILRRLQTGMSLGLNSMHPNAKCMTLWEAYLSIPDYKFWKQIGITERQDNNTIRAVFGNDVAVKAIADKHINPWPDGAILVKATWREHGDGMGLARTGDFVQVEMMKRDSKKYRSTAGWGWGRCLGSNLTPDARTADLKNACIDCHTPLRHNDYVFTTPMMGQQ